MKRRASSKAVDEREAIGEAIMEGLAAARKDGFTKDYDIAIIVRFHLSRANFKIVAEGESQ